MNNQQLLGIGELLNQTFQIYKSRIGIFLGIMVIPFLISSFFYLPFLALYPLIIFGKFLGPFLLPFLLLAAIVFITFGIVAIVISLWAQVSLLFAIKERQQRIGFKESFTKGWSKVLSYWWISIISGFIVMGGYVLFIIPGIILSVLFSLAAYVLISEGKKGMTALFRSKQLIKGYWGKVFWRFLALGIIVLLISLVAGFIPLLRNFIYLFIAPFSITFGFLIYENLKQLKRGVPFEPPKRKTKIGYVLIGVTGFLLIPAAIITTFILILL